MHSTASGANRILREDRKCIHIDDSRVPITFQCVNVLGWIPNIYGRYENISPILKSLPATFNLTFYATQAESSTPRRLIFIFHISGSFFQVILFTYTCDGLIEESSNIGIAMYSAAWATLPMDETGRSLRKDMQLIIMRSKRPCYLT